MFFLFLLFPQLVLAKPEPISIVQKLSPGRQLQVQISLPEANKPSFLFLPGVNRSLLLSEPAAQELIQRGNGVVAFNFSVQPLSLATLPKGERPAFYDSEVTLEALAEETQRLAVGLARTYGLKNLIPVSLSYTGAVSFHLKGFPQVIDSVPLSSMAAFNPELAMYRNWLKAGELFNPYFGPIFTRTSLDNAYRLQWEKQVMAISQQFRLPDELHAEFVDGYIRLSRAAEDFEWKNDKDRTPRVFVLAAKENPALLRNQLELVRERLASGRKESVFVVEDSGHVIPAEQPGAYARILDLVARGQNRPGLTVVKPSSREWKSYGPAESLPLLEKAIRDLPTLPAGSRNSAPERDPFPGTL